jgi:Uma2 family endonuclease
MPAGDAALRRATLADLIAAEAEGRRVELLDGVLMDKEAAGDEHGAAHQGVSLTIGRWFTGRGGGDVPGGWVFRIEPSLLAPNGDAPEPDIAGWRRDRFPLTKEYPIRVAPDWVCEIVYSSHARDIGYKTRVYHSMHIGHYWVVDMRAFTLTVYRWTPEGYVFSAAVDPSVRARLEPFDAVELPSWELFGFEEPTALRG